MQRPWLGLFVCLGACAAGPAAPRPSLPPLPGRHHDPHLAKDELRWAAVRDELAVEELGEQALAAFDREDWAVAYARTLELMERHLDAPETQRLLWVFAASSAAVGESEHAERALVSLLCTEAAPSPLLEGTIPRARLAAGGPCTAAPGFRRDRDSEETVEPEGLALPGGEPLPVYPWLLLARAQAEIGEEDCAHVSFTRVARLAPAGSDARSEARAWRIWQTHDQARAFRESAALVDEGGRPDDVALATEAAARTIIDFDWDRDGRKDSRSGLDRTMVARWLATSPPGAVPITTRVLEMHLEARRCDDARRVHRRLIHLGRPSPEGPAPGAAFAGPVAACLPR